MQSKTLIITYPNGATQRVKPSVAFNGDWDSLAFQIGAQFFPEIGGKRTVKYRVE